jgi:hypothetical protein
MCSPVRQSPVHPHEATTHPHPNHSPNPNQLIHPNPNLPSAFVSCGSGMSRWHGDRTVRGREQRTRAWRCDQAARRLRPLEQGECAAARNGCERKHAAARMEQRTQAAARAGSGQRRVVHKGQLREQAATSGAAAAPSREQLGRRLVQLVRFKPKNRCTKPTPNSSVSYSVDNRSVLDS